MKEMPGAAWTQCEAGTEEVKVSMAVKRQNSLKCCVFCFEIVRLKCFSFSDEKRKGKE